MGDDDTWTVKDVVGDLKADLVTHLNKQDVELADISRKVDSKADKTDLLLISGKIDGLGTRVTVLEDHKLEVEASKRWRNRAWGVVGSVAGVAAIIVGALIGARVH